MNDVVVSTERPWGSNGIKVDEHLSPSEMLQLAGLDWQVEKHRSYIDLQDPALVEQRSHGHNDINVIKKVPINRSALVRTSDQKIIADVTPDWVPLQNVEAFKFFTDFVKAGNMHMDTVGSMKDGKLIWALAKVDDGFTIGRDDRVDSFLLFTNPHEFGKAIDIRFMPIRFFCTNCLTRSLGKKGMFDQEKVVKINHRKEFDPEIAKTALGLAHNQLELYKQQAEFLASKRWTEDKLDLFFRSVFPKGGDTNEKSRNHELALKVMDTQPGAHSAEGSWWQAFNAVTYMTDHLMGRSQDTRLYSAWFDSNSKLKVKALDLAVEMAR